TINITVAFSHDTTTTQFYTLSLHDALPISDGRWIYFDFANHGGQHVARVRLSDGRIERLIEGERSVSAFDFDEDGNVAARLAGIDRKSTRLNSSHVKISYAVFCLKKKTK